jgi:hypothetical protein
VLAITGNGLKTVEALQDKTDKPHTIPPQLNAFRKLMTEIG